jgi:hypothetical protein
MGRKNYINAALLAERAQGNTPEKASDSDDEG